MSARELEAMAALLPDDPTRGADGAGARWGNVAEEEHERLIVKNAAGDVRGHIKENIGLGNFFALCRCHRQCVKTRTYRPGGGRGAGFPLGLLSAWLLSSDRFPSKSEHMAYKPSFQERREARNTIKAQHNYHLFVEKEPPTDPGQSEPEQIPNH